MAGEVTQIIPFSHWEQPERLCVCVCVCVCVCKSFWRQWKAGKAVGNRGAKTWERKAPGLSRHLGLHLSQSYLATLRGREPKLSLADSQAGEQKLRAHQGDGAQVKPPVLELGAKDELEITQTSQPQIIPDFCTISIFNLQHSVKKNQAFIININGI